MMQAHTRAVAQAASRIEAKPPAGWLRQAPRLLLHGSPRVRNTLPSKQKPSYLHRERPKPFTVPKQACPFTFQVQGFQLIWTRPCEIIIRLGRIYLPAIRDRATGAPPIRRRRREFTRRDCAARAAPCRA